MKTDSPLADVYVGLGSNLNDPLKQIHSALTALAHLPKTVLITASPLYQSDPMGPQNQPVFINAVAQLQTTLSPFELLDVLHQIEQRQGRQRTVHWGPRTLDLDILLYGQEQIATSTLVIPHDGLKERVFVLYPLADIAPDLILPDGTSLSALISQHEPKGLVRIS